MTYDEIQNLRLAPSAPLAFTVSTGDGGSVTWYGWIARVDADVLEIRPVGGAGVDFALADVIAITRWDIDLSDQLALEAVGFTQAARIAGAAIR